MKRFKRVLAVFDDGPGGDEVLVRAITLAKANGARLYVARPLPRVKSRSVVDEVRRHLPRLVPWFEQEGVCQVSTHVLPGTPYAEIIRLAIQEDVDLVIVSDETGRTMLDAVFGGTVANLVQKCPCAVWVVKHNCAYSGGGVLAALDFDVEGRGKDELAGKVLSLAASVAAANGTCLHAVHIWNVQGSEGEMLKSEIPNQTKCEILRRHEGLRRERLQAMLRLAVPSGIPFEMHLPRGNRQFGMIELANRLNVDLVVLGTPGRSGFFRLLNGDFAETLLGDLRCDVLAVKGDGFQTPVLLPEAEFGRQTPRVEARSH